MSDTYSKPRLPICRLAALAAAGLLAFTASAFAQQNEAQAVVPNRITQTINEKSLVTLKGNIHPLANARNDRGLVSDSLQLERLHLVLKRSASQEATLKQYISDLHTPGSPNYHKWLTPQQFGQQFGPSDQDIATVESWLQSHGFTVSKVNPGKQTIEFSGTAAQLRSAFHTQIHKYVVNGETHYANANNPEIPAALAPVVGGFVSLNNFRLHRYSHLLGKASYDPASGKAKPQWNYPDGSGEDFVLSPADYAVQYDLSPLYSAGTTGSGQTIAIINDSNINVSLVNNFRSLFGLSSNPPQVVIDGNDPGIDGINNPDGPNYDSVEAYLDVEWAGAVAPDATVDLVIGADTALESGLALAMEHAVYTDIAPVISVSFGECEADLGSSNQFFSELWEQAAAQGITVLVSTGDNGSAGCDDDNSQYYAVGGQAVNGFASTPYNVAVGGTDFYYQNGTSDIPTYWNVNSAPTATPTTTLLKVIPEQPWNNSQFGSNLANYYDATGVTTLAAASGGASTVGNVTIDETTGNITAEGPYAKPSWQQGTGVPSDNARDLPDVSLFAANGLNGSYYPLCAVDGDCQSTSSGSAVQISGVGGTSAAAPSFAGIMALINQKYGRQGQADYVLYPLAKQYPASFHDVVNGTISVPCAATTTSTGVAPLDCIAVSSPNNIQVEDPTYGTATEGQIGTGTTPEYNAGTGYDLASGWGTVDANQLVTNWGNIKFTSTTVTLTSPTSGQSFTHGSEVTFSGTVSGGSSIGGSVVLMTDSTLPSNQGEATATVSNGSFSGSLYYLPGGTYNVWAQYGGDGTNGASTSSKAQITISPESSSIYFNAVTPQGNNLASIAGVTNISYGTPIYLSAQPFGTTYYNDCVNTSNPSSTNCHPQTAAAGTVTFSDSGKALNTAVLNAEGDAEYTQGAYAPGSHSVTASYSGDASYNASTASAITFSVVKDTPEIGLTATNVNSSGQLTGGQATILTILVENDSAITGGAAAPTGSVTISGFPSGVVPTSATLSAAVDPSTGAPDGVATITIPSTVAAGTYTVTVNYGGDTNYNQASTSGSIQITAKASGLLPSTITGTANPTTTSSTTGITANVTVTGSGSVAPTGTVLFSSSGYSLGSATLTPGTSGDTSTVTVTLTSQTLYQGANEITLQYSGDSVYLPSATTISISNPLSDFSIVPNSSIVAVSSSGSATDTINLSSVNGFAGTVNFTCTAATGVTCSIAPTSATLSSGSTTTATLTLTASSTTSANHLRFGWAAGSGIAVAGLLLLTIPARRRSWRAILGVVLFASVISFGIGCGSNHNSNSGGSTSGGGGGTGGTTTTNVNVLITATSGSTVHTLGITAAVQTSSSQ